jgi:large subunit ribosomal protein L10
VSSAQGRFYCPSTVGHYLQSHAAARKLILAGSPESLQPIRGKEETALAINREKKEELVQIYKEQIARSSVLIFTDYRGATVAQVNALRSRLRANDTTYMVAKNTLIRIALEQSGRELEYDGLLDGPNAVAFVGEDIGKGVKALKDWIRETGGELVTIKGAILERDVLNASRTEALSELPTREQMLAKLLGTINAPASQLVRVINEPGASLARVLKAHADKQQEAA